MNTSINLISSQLLRHQGGDARSCIEPKSRRDTTSRKLAHERLSTVAVTGTNGKTTITRMVAHIADYMGVVVRVTGGSLSARSVLADPTLALAVLEIDPSDVAARGFGYEQADAAVLMDAGKGHLGQDASDLRRVQSLVAERVREGGALILNADDPYLRAALEHPHVDRASRRVVYFSLDASCPTIKAHREAGGLVVTVRDGWILEASGAAERRVVRVTDLPVTLGGTARFQIANTLAVVAAARAVGFGLAEIACALRTFESSIHNVGKGDLYQVGSGYVLLDSAHTPASIKALCDTVGQWPARRITGVLSARGDHRDAILKLSEEAAVHSFDRLLVNQDEALTRAISEMVPDEVVVVVSDSPERMIDILERYEARPVHAFERQGRRTFLSAA